MDEVTTSQLLAEMKPAWRAALGDRVSHEYVAGFVRRNRARLEAELAPIAAAMNAVPEPSPECSVERALEAAAPMIAEAEQEIAAATGEPRHVVMASLEAGGIILLSPLGYIGGELFQTYRDDTSRLQYVSYPKKGNRGIPKAVARAVLALERDGFEVRAETPEVVKSLIVTGGLDHALPVGPPPPRAPREDPARPPTRTSDPSLIARVNALAADPPTSTLKYLVKTLRERGDLPLQVKDWKEGGWRPVETAIEEAEGKAARKLARKPKAERLRADGVERSAKDANEEHAAQALVQLANMDPDKARDVNEAGFSKSDVATGHTLARRWEATGELTGDEWEWAVAVANKYRRQVGPLPEPKGKAKRQQSEARTIDMGNNESLSMGVFEDTDGTYYAMTFSQSKDGFKTRAGAERWLARHVSPDQQSTVKPETVDDRLFVGVMPTGIVYADRSREVDGDYARCAFLPFDTLALEVAPKCPKDMLGAIKADAATIIAKRGEQFKISASDQTVVLGSKYVDASATTNAVKTIRRNTSLGKQILTAPAEVHAYSLSNGFSGSEVEVSRFVAMMANNIASGQDLSIRTGPRAGWYTVQLHSNLWYEVRLPSAPIDNRKVEEAEKRARVKQMKADVSAHNAAIMTRRESAGRYDEQGEEARMGAALRGARDVEEAAWEQAMRDGLAVEMLRHADPGEARKAVVANLTRNIDYYK